MAESWKRMGLEQRIAAAAAILLALSTIGPFSFVEGAELLVAFAVLLLLHKRAQGREFHLPFADGTALMAAGLWEALLIAARLLDRPFGQNALALVCAALLVAAGARLRVTQPPEEPEPEIEWEDAPTMAVQRRRPRRSGARPPDPADARTEPLPPPEFKRPRDG